MEGFWQLIAAHAVADFVLQSDRMAHRKAWGDPAALSAHFLIHVAAMVILGHTFASLAAVVAWLSIALIHVLLDWAKSKVVAPEPPTKVDFFAFLIDQALHLFVIVFIWTRADFRANESIRALYRLVFGDDDGRRWGEGLFDFLSASTTGWIAFSVGLFIVFGGAVLVRKALDLFASPDVAAAADMPDGASRYTYRRRLPDRSHDQKVGRAIGMMERTLVYALLLQGALSAVGLMLAAKSIARFRELDDRSFAEYYLVGTFLSLLVALAGFALVRWFAGPDTFLLLRRM